MISKFYVDTITVETYLGTNGMGQDTFAAPVTLAPPNGVYADDSRQMIRDPDGNQVVSETTIYTFSANASLFVENSRVTVNGNQTRVLKTNNNTSGSVGLPDHVAVNLQ